MDFLTWIGHGELPFFPAVPAYPNFYGKFLPSKNPVQTSSEFFKCCTWTLYRFFYSFFWGVGAQRSNFLRGFPKNTTIITMTLVPLTFAFCRLGRWSLVTTEKGCKFQGPSMLEISGMVSKKLRDRCH